MIDLRASILGICYLVSSVAFIAGLKMMSSPKTAQRGNTVAASGMLLALAATVLLYNHAAASLSGFQIKLAVIGAGFALGGAAGWVTARKVKMTAMPQLVSLFNGMGGGCAALIGLAEFSAKSGNPATLGAVAAGMLIGCISFAGSVVAFLKLSGVLNRPLRIPAYNVVDGIVLVGVIVLAWWSVASAGTLGIGPSYGAFAAAILYGILFVIPIGGADMPVVISLLNSFTGLAVAFSGFAYDNQAMITGGILVGAAGTFLTIIMCKSMNRSLVSVIFGAFGGTAGSETRGSSAKGGVKDVSVSDAAILLNYASSVMVVPGYGLAVAQGQHALHELEAVLEAKGIHVAYAIHPVAGRMPGHMNVLLAESNVSYDKLLDMESANPQFQTTDVVLVVGANDVVNPAARNTPASPIYGMPILEVENARNIIVIKRSMNTGYAGIENELFFNEKTSMLFGDAKKVISDLVSEVKKL
jgi:NAD(P) transhydrogenase subunit beta